MKFKSLIYRLINAVCNPKKIINSIPSYIIFFKDCYNYFKLENSEDFNIFDLYPCIYDKTQLTGFDSHYFYQDIWAFRKIYESRVKIHVDIGSRIDFVGFLTVITNVIFIDIRPVNINLKNFECKKGDILHLPFEDNSINSLSCLHVAEHIGLGRYGDSLDPAGTKKACLELSRVLSINGNLYFAVPIGKPRINFNAHRVHSIEQVINYFSKLKLVEFSYVDDNGYFFYDVNINSAINCNYGCGLFHFTKLESVLHK